MDTAVALGADQAIPASISHLAERAILADTRRAGRAFNKRAHHRDADHFTEAVTASSTNTRKPAESEHCSR